MGEERGKLYLRESRARQQYACARCGRVIQRGRTYFRDEPHPFDRMRGHALVQQLCYECVTGSPHPPAFKRRGASDGVVPTPWDARLGRSGAVESIPQLGLNFDEPVEVHRTIVRVVNATDLLLRRWATPEDLAALGPDGFEELVCGNLDSLGLEVRRISPVNRRDGAIDIVFWPRRPCVFPFLGAVQVKHHRDPRATTGPIPIREMRSALAANPFNIGVVVTNTTFTPDAEWAARREPIIVRLRGLQDVQRWLRSSELDDVQWRDLPERIELCPGVTITIPRPRPEGGL